MTTALDIVTSALRNIGVYETGQPLTPYDSANALQILNDLLDAWSQEHLLCYASIENILAWVPGQNKYTIGNAPGGTFTGTLVSGTPTISNVTVPSALVANSFLTDDQAQIPANTRVVSTNPGALTVTMNANALSTVSSAENITYTIPGNFYIDAVTGLPIQRPLKITNCFTRITASGNTGLDYQCPFRSRDEYTLIGLKGLAGPWPIVGYYDPTFPLGTIYVYPTPSQAGEVHLWTDTLLSNFASLTTQVSLPQGYVRALKKNLAVELAPEYGKQVGPQLNKQAMESKATIKGLNLVPPAVVQFDRDIVRNRRIDASWIMDGGFNRV